MHSQDINICRYYKSLVTIRVFVNGGSNRILHDEGYIDVTELGTIENKYYHIKDHLGNVRAVIREEMGEPEVIQAKTYYPFGMVFTSEMMQGALTDKANPYLYNTKEQQDMPGLWFDFGARFQDPQLGRWHNIDPMCEISRRWTPYQYTYNNPIRFIDPDGMVVDDYFNKKGKFLGSDEASTDNVKIIEQDDWDSNKTVESDGIESIDHEKGESLSQDHSRSGISEEASLAVYDHYNPTDLPLSATQNEAGDGGMTFYAEKVNNNTSERIDIKIKGNNRLKISDHANEIMNLFEHENIHNEDYKSVGFDTYDNSSSNRKEQYQLK